MNESGDKNVLPFFSLSEKALVKRLQDISDEVKHEKTKRNENRICGWQPIQISISQIDINLSDSKSDIAASKSRTNAAIQWSNAVFLERLQKKNLPPTKRKMKKFHPKRLEELSVPRRNRGKVEIKNCKKDYLPLEYRNPVDVAAIFDHKFYGISQIALQYGSSGPELRRLSNHRQYPDTSRVGSTQSAKDVKNVPRTNPNAGRRSVSAKNRRENRKEISLLPSKLVKTRANIAPAWECLPVASDASEEDWNNDPLQKPLCDIDLPLPPQKLKSDRKKERSTANRFQKKEAPDWSTKPPLPPIRLKTSKRTLNQYKRPLGSVTALTRGNIEAGMKMKSIGNIKRYSMPQRSIILPRTSGDTVIVPLLPQSPDFLHRIS